MLTAIFTVAAIGVAAVTGLSTLLSAFYNNKEKQNTLITRFGKHVATITEPGLHMKIPFLDQIASRVGMDLMQVTEPLTTKTKDDLFTDLPITIQFVVDDAKKYYFDNRNGIENMKKLVSAAVRTACADKEFQELFGDREGISNTVIEHTSAKVEEYGLKIKHIIIDQPSVSKEVQAQFDDVKASERAKEAARNRAEAHRIEVVTKSEADALAQKNAGKGAADFRKAILDGYKDQITELTADGKVGREEALHIVMRSMELDALREVGAKGNLVIVPESMTGGGLAEINTLKALRGKPANDKGGAPAAASLVGGPG